MALPTFAVPPAFLSAVLESKEMEKLIQSTKKIDIVDMKHTETYRCPGCFQIQISYKDGFSSSEIKTASFMTSLMSFNGQIQVFRDEKQEAKP